MVENNNSRNIEHPNSEINWHCKICKDLANYAEGYLHLRESAEYVVQDEDTQLADLTKLKYYYALLYLLDDIHDRPICPHSEPPSSESEAPKCPEPEKLHHYRNIFNTYAAILKSGKGVKKIIPKCNICAVLPYSLFLDMDMFAKNIHSVEMEDMKKLEFDAVITAYYLETYGQCEQLEECSHKINWIELNNSVRILNEYLETKDHKALQISLNSWNKFRTMDNILTAGLNAPADSKKFQTQEPSGMLDDKSLVYLDFGVYQLYENNEVFRTQLDAYAEMDEIQFVYSPAHMEEVCRMQESECENKRLKNISHVCNNHEVLPAQKEGLKIYIEPVDACFTRAKAFQELNKYAEEAECARFESLQEQVCTSLEWDEKEMENFKKKISDFPITKLFDPMDMTIDNKFINRIFLGICLSQIPLEGLKDYCKEKRDYHKIQEAVHNLYMLMNALGYHKNKIEKRTKFTPEALYPTYDRKFYRTIRSGFYDYNHLYYASRCEYFITCDQALSKQAEGIYSYLGCKTNVIYCDKNTPDPALQLAMIGRKPNS